MKKNTLLEQYLYDLQEGNLAAAAYAAGKTAHTIAKPVLKVAGKVIKAVGRAGADYAKRKLASYRKPKGKAKYRHKPEGAASALVKGLRGKDA